MLQTYTPDKNLIEQFDVNDLELLTRRTNLKKEQITTICAHHHQMLVVRYEGNQKSCCDPFVIHKKACKGSLRVITMQTALEAETKDFNLVPGKKFCPNCRSRITNILTKSSSSDEEDIDIPEILTHSGKDSVDEYFEAAGISPIKVRGLHQW